MPVVDKDQKLALTTRVRILIIGIITITACIVIFTLKYQESSDYRINLLNDDRRELSTVWFYEDGMPAIYGDELEGKKTYRISTKWDETIPNREIVSMEVCEMGVRVFFDGFLIDSVHVEDKDDNFRIADHETIYLDMDNAIKRLKSQVTVGQLKNPHNLTIEFTPDNNRGRFPTVFVESEIGALSEAVHRGYIELVEFVVLFMCACIFMVLFLVYYLNKIEEALGFLLLSLFCFITSAYGISNSNVASILGWSTMRTTFAEYVTLLLMMVPAVLYVRFTCRSNRRATLFAAFLLTLTLNVQLLLYAFNIASLTEMSWLTTLVFFIQATICLVALMKDWHVYRSERALTHLCANVVLNIMLMYEMLHRVFLDENSKSHYLQVGIIAYIIVIASNTLKQNVTMSADNMSLQLYKKLSLEDSLTGLGSRAAYEIFLIEKGNSKLTDKEMSVLFVDINNLKQTNDIKGHAEGDRLIKTVSGILQDVIKESHSDCYRIGGDEFVIIANQKDEAEKIPGKIRERLTEHNTKNKLDYSVAIGLSSGVIGHKNPYGEGICTMTELVQEADRRMYKDKNEYKASLKK